MMGITLTHACLLAFCVEVGITHCVVCAWHKDETRIVSSDHHALTVELSCKLTTGCVWRVRAWDQDRSSVNVLEVSMTAIMEADAWADATEMSQALYQLQPGHPLAGAGYALGLARNGRVDQAQAVLKGLNGRRIHDGLRRQAKQAVAEGQTNEN